LLKKEHIRKAVPLDHVFLKKATLAARFRFSIPTLSMKTYCSEGTSSQAFFLSQCNSSERVHN